MRGFLSALPAFHILLLTPHTYAAEAVATKAAFRSLGLGAGAGEKNRPVSKVITLLKDMLSQLEKEQGEDEEIYDKMACWCETNDKEKTKTIADAEARITDLTTKIDEYTATSARLSTEIDNLKQDIAKSQEALDQATALREKEQAEFQGEEKDLLESVQALKAAIIVLGKHHGEGAMLQAEKRKGRDLQLHTVAETLRLQLHRHASLLKGVLSPSERRAADAFVQSPEEALLARAFSSNAEGYSPGSGQIFGILKQMLETFEENLSATQKQEMKSQMTYEGLKSAKQDQITAAQTQMERKQQELSTADMNLAQSQQDLDDTKASLSADQQFLLNLKEKCSMTDNEWQERQKTRQLEMTAVSKALAILASDDSHDLFTKTFNPAASFVQKGSEVDSQRRVKASEILEKVAKKNKNPLLSTLANRVKLDAFTKVKKAIDDMIAQLLKDKEDEIQHRDFCVDEFNQNAVQTERKGREKDDLTAHIEDLQMTIQQTEREIETLQEEITTMQTEMQRAGEDRAKEHKVFQEVLADQRETQALLHKAIEVLEQVYAAQPTDAASLVQRQEPVGPPPPPGFSSYKKNEASTGVLRLLDQIIADAKAMEVETTKAESDAQAAYEEFVTDTNRSIEGKNMDIVNKSSIKATAEGDLVQAQEAKQGVLTEIEQLSNYNAELHSSCDFITRNFEVRQTARDEEVDALRQAKAILSGADFGQFLQIVTTSH